MKELKEQLSRIRFEKYSGKEIDDSPFVISTEPIAVYENGDDKSEDKDLVNPVGEKLAVFFLFDAQGI